MQRLGVGVFLFGLGLAGCGAVESPPEQPVAPELVRDRWLAPAELGFAEQHQWGLPLPHGFAIVVLSTPLLLAQCEAATGDGRSGIKGCVADGRRVLLRDDLAPSGYFHMVLLHEMGHLLGGGAHIDDPACPVDGTPGPFVMCASGQAMAADGSGPELEAADFDWVLGL